jgi:hypothetical protein
VVSIVVVEWIRHVSDAVSSGSSIIRYSRRARFLAIQLWVARVCVGLCMQGMDERSY